MIGLLLMALAVALAWAAGMHAGRAAERRLLQSGKVDRTGIRPTIDWEIELRKARGARLPHPNPESATRIRKAQMKR